MNGLEKKIILASASPRRRELLVQAGIEFEVFTCNVDEETLETVPSRMVETLSVRKARAAAELLGEGCLVIGADTVVSMKDRIFGKPENIEMAKTMLGKLQGGTHQVYTGVTLLTREKGGEIRNTFSVRTDVTMYSMTDREIEDYIATGEPMDKAGGYGIQGRAAIFVKEISGDYCNVVGLPVARLYHELKRWK